MLFSKEELDEFLISNEQKHENTPNELKGAMQRKDFLEWMDELKNELKTQFLHESHLDPTLKEERIKRASVDFDYFARTYFPHYFTIKGECGLHLHLNEVFTKIALKKESKGEKHAIAAPRAHGKSTYTSQLFPLWCLVFNYKSFIVEISDAVELMEGMLEAIKAELEGNPHLKLDFPEVVGIGKTWRVGEFVSNNGVKIKAFGSGKRLRGVRYGVKRPDLVILDDLENDTNVRSKDQRDKLEDWVDEAVLNLGSADGSLDVLYIGTILHNDSVLSRKLKLLFILNRAIKFFKEINHFKDELYVQFFSEAEPKSELCERDLKLFNMGFCFDEEYIKSTYNVEGELIRETLEKKDFKDLENDKKVFENKVKFIQKKPMDKIDAALESKEFKVIDEQIKEKLEQAFNQLLNDSNSYEELFENLQKEFSDISINILEEFMFQALANSSILGYGD